ncbi:phytanoyl-CoA dioxygenase domain-containing protein 1-like [Octopus sinensis]|uniref:Phytanoyl-CoA dioxygenase domain-containing protein 1-like n=1 Tax=Octopus sinensis TaxID=2607531 RepID=A0A6P7TKM6_9MOLL|nr:phytanoyl-CoA dioxygenase domain-containing protein 1-like [Octopus sinensis]
MAASIPSNLSQNFNRDGYVTGIPVLTLTEVKELVQNFNALEKEIGKENSQYSLHNVHTKLPWVMKMAAHPNILRPLRAILGDNIFVLDSRFICKYPDKENSRKDGAKQYVAWHQDVRYWGVEGMVVTVWLAVDKADIDNGCMQVIPGSHKFGIFEHIEAKEKGNLLTSNQEIPLSLFNVEKAVPCPLNAGEMSLHHGLTVHGSEPNLSDRRRCGYVIRYVATDAYSINDPNRPRTFPATVLVSGKDELHNFTDHAPEWFKK